MTDQIKPCPFCGGTDIEIEGRGKVFRRDKGGLEPRYFVLRHVGKPEHIDEFDTCHVYIRARHREDLINYWSTRNPTATVLGPATTQEKEND